MHTSSPVAPLDSRMPDALGRKNVTRRTNNMSRKLLREGKLHLLLVYWLIMQSDLGREGIEHSGSYRFADHLYQGKPSGRNRLGQWVDAVLLRMRASRAFRRRYLHAQTAMQIALRRHIQSSPDTPFRVLAIPCGIPRDIAGLADQLGIEHPDWLARIHYTGVDLDPKVMELACDFLGDSGLGRVRLVQADALDVATYPQGLYHCAISTGFGEFLTNDELLDFYRNVHRALADNGTFYTSATRSEPWSESLLKAFELDTHSRSAGELGRLLEAVPWRSLKLTEDPTGLQTFATAEKSPDSCAVSGLLTPRLGRGWWNRSEP